MKDEENHEVKLEDVAEFMLSDPQAAKPVDMAKAAIIDVVIRGWLKVDEDPSLFCRTAYHCLRRLPIPSVDPSLVQELVKNWTIDQRKENWVVAMACLRYAVAKVIYDLGDNASDWTEPTSDICPVRIGQKMGILHEYVMVEPDFDTWKHADEMSMQRILSDVRLACSIRGLYPELPAFTDEW